MTGQPQSLTATDRLALFSDRLKAVGGHVINAETTGSLAGIVHRIADDGGIDTDATLWMSRALRDAMPDLAPALTAMGLSVDVPDDAAAVRDAPMGLAIARAAIAEAGSVLLVEPVVADRAVTLVTQSLIVICPLTALVPSLDEAAGILRDLTGEEASYMTFVTGPSRTADIERQLTVGVQGPGRLHVIFLSDETP
jgi:L-lactate dehydrogenase complex protein LldG